jgi:uncharacterized protein YdeI (YjbR/CyaY-like superfamily)
MKVEFFESPAELRRWLERHHERETELWVGLYKKNAGKPSVTWPEVVDEVLCFGWIDGVRKTLDDDAYVIRLTPRKARSTWSTVNVRRAQALTEMGRMRPAGLEAFQARDEKRSGIYSFEQRKPGLDRSSERLLRANASAWAFFQAQPPWYRRTSSWWVVSAKKEETRRRRLATLIENSARGRWIKELQRPERKGAAARVAAKPRRAPSSKSTGPRVRRSRGAS